MVSTDNFPFSPGAVTETYDEFRIALKDMLHAIGLKESDFGTHGFRKGRITDLDSAGVPDRLKLEVGRWRSDGMLSVYVDKNRTVQSLLAAFERATQLGF